MVKENEEVQCEQVIIYYLYRRQTVRNSFSLLQVEDTEYYPLNEQLEDFYDMLIVEDVPVKLNEAKDVSAISKKKRKKTFILQEMIIENIDYFAEAGKMLNDGDAYNARIMVSLIYQYLHNF